MMLLHIDRLKIMLVKCRPHLLSALLLVIITTVVYGQILGHDFIRNWDDNRYVLENADIQGFGRDRLKAVFTRYYTGNYAPVQMISYMLDYSIWGQQAGGYLLTNLLLHAANGLLLYHLLIQLIGGRLAAWSGAALFLLHPVQVETVAWVSQRKTLLAMLFFLLAWELYIVWREKQPGKAHVLYVASLVSVILAMLSKSIAVIFPVVIMLFDYCYSTDQRRYSWRHKLPYFFVALSVAVIAVVSQTPDPTEWGAGGGRAGYHGGSAITTFFSMMPVFCRYLWMIIWPSSLATIYDVPLHSVPDLTVIGAMILLSIVAYLVFRLFRYDSRIGFWPVFILVSLLPVAQIIPLVTMMNDRYLYFPLIGIAALTCHGVRGLERCRVRERKLMTIVCIPLVIFAFVAWNRTGVWRSALTLWADTTVKSPGTALAWESLGEAYQYYNKRPDYELAKKAYYRAIKLSPGNDLSRYNLANVYVEQNDFNNADRIFQELLKLSPQNVMGWTAYGELALRQLNYVEAENRYRMALSLQPEAIQIHKRIGNLMVITGRLAEAKSAHLRIEELQGGNDPLTAYDLARIEAMSGDTGGAIHWLEQSLKRGYSDFAGIMVDEELTPVLSDGRFSELVSRYFPKGR